MPVAKQSLSSLFFMKKEKFELKGRAADGTSDYLEEGARCDSFAGSAGIVPNSLFMNLQVYK